MAQEVAGSHAHSLLAAIRTITAAKTTELSALFSELSSTEQSLACDAFRHLNDLYAAQPGPRNAKVNRNTKETNIRCSVHLDGTGQAQVKTGLGFLDHMLSALAKHSMIDISLVCEGDLDVDDHHTTEDSCLALGHALDKALGSRAGIKRYGSAYAPLDEALARAVVDISGRPSHDVNLALKRDMVGQVSSEMLQHALQSFAIAAKLTLHVDVVKGENDHHKAEAAFKALALALRDAISVDSKRTSEIPSTKGTL